jgi:HPt (histidine-containing phosphotransfer) domain-containing protein
MIDTPISKHEGGPSFLLWNASRSIERLGGQESLIVKLVTLFLRDAPEQIEKALYGIQHEDYECSHIAIHSLKGTSSNFCTKSLELLCDDLLMSLKELNWGKSLAVQEKLSEEYGKLEAELRQFIQQ